MSKVGVAVLQGSVSRSDLHLYRDRPGRPAMPLTHSHTLSLSLIAPKETRDAARSSQLGRTRTPRSHTHLPGGNHTTNTSRAGTIPTRTRTTLAPGPGLVPRPPCGLSAYPLFHLSRERAAPQRKSSSDSSVAWSRWPMFSGSAHAQLGTHVSARTSQHARLGMPVSACASLHVSACTSLGMLVSA